MEALAQSPGTVSRILWHFTGGPLWNAAEQRQNTSPKPASQAYNNLKSILKTRELRLGSYKEVIRVRIAQRRKYNQQKREFEIQRNVIEQLESSPVCCLADVPIMHLAYLAPRYGKFAIGFHRRSITRNGFNPVLYALDDAKVVHSIYRGFSELGNISTEVFRIASNLVQESVSDFVAANSLENSPDLDGLEVTSVAADGLDLNVRAARESFENFLGLVKTFAPEEFGTIYCEREWRALTPFKFDHEDIAMVVVPRSVGKIAYFQPFVSTVSPSISLPRIIPIVPWEDLIEH